jgi:hypothetical protein
MQQHRNGHRANSTGNWRDGGSHLANRLEIHIANKLTVGQAIHTDIDHNSPWFDHVGFQELCLADGDYCNVSLPGQLG